VEQEGPVGQSAAHRRVLDLLDKVAATDAEVLLCGPSGVGKELYARYLHQRSPRRQAPFVAVNCGTLAPELLENELFGHVGGAFTGARAEHAGLAATAHRGTLFLDEVDALTAASQAKLLRFVQEKEYRRLGDPQLRHADLRFVSATNCNLEEAVRDGRFREDLFFRLRVVPIEVAPLCERPEDIELLSEKFAQRYGQSYRLKPVVIAESARRRMADYRWPGNVRELENCIRYLTCIQLSRPVEAADLPLLGPPAPELARGFQQKKQAVVEQFERERVISALRESGGNIARAARAEQTPRRTFFELMRKHQIRAEHFRS
jgi:two-component system, NtrC family, response regulator GlrR